MAYLFNRFREAVNVLARNRSLSRNPRQLQFEADINRLFLYTSYKRLGKDAEEAELEEIIDMASKASVADQQSLVQENIHLQIKNFCESMDSILVESECSIQIPSDENSVPRRPSGLSFAIGNRTPVAGITDVPETKSLSGAEVSNLLKNHIGYSASIKRSLVPHEEAGQGLFVDGEAEAGSVVAFYPGMVYNPAYYRYIPGYPRVDADNPYLIARYDDTVINAKPWGCGGESRETWEGGDHHVEKQSLNSVDKGSDRLWKMLSKPLVGQPLGTKIDVLERRNPLALGHFANHPSKGMAPNVMVCPYDFPLTEKDMRVYIPNVMFGGVDDVAMKRYGRFWFKMWKNNNSLEMIPMLKCLVLVATRDLCDEEVLLNYRLSNARRRPSWYTPFDEDEDSRRWS